MYPDSYLESLHLIQKIGCIYDFNREHKGLNKTAWTAYVVISLIICQGYYATDLLIVTPSLSQNTEILMEHLDVTILVEVLVLKVAVCLLYKKDLTFLIQSLDDPRFRYEDCDEYKPGQFTAASSLWCKNWAKSLMGIVLIGSNTRQLLSLLAYYNGAHLLNERNVTCKEFLAFYADTPFPSDTVLTCGLGIVTQTIGGLLLCMQLISVEVTFAGIGMYIRCHFINLEGAFRTIKVRCNRRLQLPDDFCDQDVPMFQKEFERELKKLSEHLAMLLNSIKSTEKIFNLNILAMMLAVMLMNSMCLYSISFMPLNNPTLYTQLQFAATMLLLFAPYCYFGDEFTIRCFKLRDCIFEMDWLTSSKVVKSAVMIHLIKLEKPPYLSIGKFAPISMNTFIQVMKGSYAYYTLMGDIGV